MVAEMSTWQPWTVRLVWEAVSDDAISTGGQGANDGALLIMLFSCVSVQAGGRVQPDCTIFYILV